MARTGSGGSSHSSSSPGDWYRSWVRHRRTVAFPPARLSTIPFDRAPGWTAGWSAMGTDSEIRRIEPRDVAAASALLARFFAEEGFALPAEGLEPRVRTYT